MQTTVSHDNDLGRRAQGARHLTMGGLLHGLGILPSGASATFVFEQNGRRIERTLSAGLSAPREPATPSTTLVPTDPFYAFAYRGDTGTLYLQYNRCANDPDRPFDAFVDAAMDAYDTGAPRRVVLDLRHNPGGNSRVLRSLYNAFDARHRNGRAAQSGFPDLNDN